jgi:AcrR family transcriptional regulator
VAKGSGRYHHGRLRDALLEAGLDLSRSAGTEAIVLREVTRRAGVTARAAYRHFADRSALVRAIADLALATMGRTIRERQQGVHDPIARLRCVGEGYIAFALDEPGWFDVAMSAINDPPAAPCADHPHDLLVEALQDLASRGRLPAGQLDAAAQLCWSGVHGFACLASSGPLRTLPRAEIDRRAGVLVTQLVDAVTGRAPRGRDDSLPGAAEPAPGAHG